MSKQISIVVPLLNESESLPELTRWIDEVMQKHSYTYELIMIDDGSTDNSWEIIEELRTSNSNIRGIKFRRNYGKSAALHVGFAAAEGEVVITMDADLQDDPRGIPNFLEFQEVWIFRISEFLGLSGFWNFWDFWVSGIYRFSGISGIP